MKKEEIKSKVKSLKKSKRWEEDIYQIPSLISDMYARGFVESAILDFDMENFNETKSALLNLLDSNIWNNRSEETQKQIEAVRGLIKGHKGLWQQTKRQAMTFSSLEEVKENEKYLNLLADSIRAAAETLKPYLNGEELEV